MESFEVNPSSSSPENIDVQILEWGKYLLMNLMIEDRQRFEPTLNGDDKYLEPVLLELIKDNWVVAGVTGYEPTLAGQRAYEQWIKKLYVLNERLEIFCGVDLDAGEFAYEKFYDFKSDEEWKTHLDQSRFVDLRIAVAEEYGVDGEEFVFMSFLNEGRWSDLEQLSGWQFDLVSGKLLEEIKLVIKNALKKSELGYTYEGKQISGAEVLQDVIKQGEALAVKLSTQDANERNRRTSTVKKPGGYETESGLDDAYKL